MNKPIEKKDWGKFWKEYWKNCPKVDYEEDNPQSDNYPKDERIVVLHLMSENEETQKVKEM